MLFGSLTRQDLEQKSLPELKDLLNEKDTKLRLTDEGILLSFELRSWEHKKEIFLKRYLGCELYESPMGYFLGSCDDCEELHEAENQLILQGAKVKDARQALKTKHPAAHSDFKLLHQCIEEKLAQQE